jgi:C4-dicarboxylate transporter DctM subunit
LAIYSAYVGRRAHVERPRFSGAAVARAARAGIWEIPLPVLIVGGIYGGLFTASDSAAVMAFYVFVVEFFVYRDLSFADLPRVVARSMMLVGAILMVLATALGLTNFLIDAQVPDKLFTILHNWTSSKTVFLLVLNAVLLVVNMVEIFSAIIIVVPIIVPIAMQYQIDPVHLGIIFLLNLEIGYMMPPMGLNLFLSSRRFDEPLPGLYRATVVFLILHIVMLLLVTYAPAVSLVLLRLRSG